MLKLDKNGNEAWNKEFGSNTSGSYSTGNSIVQTSDDGYAVAGNLKEDGYVIKMDKDGNENWKKTFVGSNNDNFYSIVQSGNDYVVAGFKGKDYIWNGPQGDLWVIKLDSNGTEAWNKTIGDGRGTNQEDRQFYHSNDRWQLCCCRTFRIYGKNFCFIFLQ